MQRRSFHGLASVLLVTFDAAHAAARALRTIINAWAKS